MDLFLNVVLFLFFLTFCLPLSIVAFFFVVAVVLCFTDQFKRGKK